MKDMILNNGDIRYLTKEEMSKYKNLGYVFTLVTTSEYFWSRTLFIDGVEVKQSITVPKGFLSDGSTFSPDISSAYIFHDYLYASHQFDNRIDCTREEADQIMIDILELGKYKIIPFLARIMFWLNPFYGVSNAWESSGNRGVILESDILFQ